MHARGLGRWDECVIAAHQVGACDPADARLGQGHSLGPTGLGRPLVHHRVKRRLDLAVGAVAAEGAAVWRARQHDVGASWRVGVLGELGKARDRALDRPQQQTGLGLGVAADLGQGSGHARRGEREGQGGDQPGLVHAHVLAHGLLLLLAEPGDERVDVTVARQVGGHEPQRSTRDGVVAVEGARELLARLAHVRGSHDHGGAPSEQALDKSSRDGTGRGTRNQGNLAGKLAAKVLGGGLRDLRQRAGVAVIRVPLRLLRHSLPGAAEALHRNVRLAQGHAGEVLARLGPAVVEKHCLARVEAGGDLRDPAGAQLGLDGFEDGGVGCFDFGVLVSDAELGQQRARGGHQRVGHLVAVGLEGCGVDHCAAGGATCLCRADVDAVAGGDVGHGGVDKRVHLGLRRRAGQSAEGAAAHRLLLAGAQQDFRLDVGNPGRGQRPGAGDVVADVCGFKPCHTENLAQARADCLGEHGAEGGVTGRGGSHALAQRGHVRLGGAVDGGHPKLGGHVHEQLVASRRHPARELLDGVGAGDLLHADLILEREEHVDGVSGAKREVGDGRAAGRSGSGSGRRGGRGCRRLGSGGGLNLLRLPRLLRLIRLLRFGRGDGVRQHDGVLARLDVEHRDVAADHVHLALGQVGQRRRGSEADLDELIDAPDEQVLRFNPAHRRGELPGQKLDEEDAGELACGSVVHRDSGEAL